MKKIIPILVLLMMLVASPAWANNPVPANVVQGEMTIVKTPEMTTYFLFMPISLNGSAPITARLDTGAAITSFPDDYLRSLGYEPFSGPFNSAEAVGNLTVYLYKIPYPTTTLQSGAQIALGQGNIVVEGVIGSQQALLGADILSQDCLSLNGYNWTLTIPPSSLAPMTTPRN